MTYLEFLPLSEAKHYLRLDNDFTDDDSSIKRMIKSVLQFIEKRTNYVLNSYDKLYFRGSSGYIDIFDYPVNYVGELTRLDYSDKVRFDADSIQVNLGYGSTDEQPPEALKECALQMIEVFYFVAEKQVNTTLLPESVLQIINSYRRFTVC